MTASHLQVVATTCVPTPQYRHRLAIELHEKAIRHHRVAALLHDAGDPRQATTHANIACRHATAALESASSCAD